MDLSLALHGLTAESLAELACAHVTTARRWLRRRQAPPAIARALVLLRFGQLAAVSPTWSGWALRAGKLVSPEGLELTPGEVRAGPLHAATVRLLQRQLAAATDTVDTNTERLERVAVLAALQNAMAAAQRAAEQLLGELTRSEQDRLFELLDSTQRRRARSLEDARDLAAAK